MNAKLRSWEGRPGPMGTTPTTRVKRSPRAAIVAAFSQLPEASALNIHNLRRAAGMSQAELARRAQISRQRLSRAEQSVQQLTASEVDRILVAVAEEPNRRAIRIREALAGSGADPRGLGGYASSDKQSRFAGKRAEDQKSPRSPLNFNCEELGWVLVKHWQENAYPVMGPVAVAVAAADAVKKAAETWQCTPQEAAERIKGKQELWLQSTLGKSDTPKPAHWWYRDGYWLNTPAEWDRLEANLTGKDWESRANELETGEEVPER